MHILQIAVTCTKLSAASPVDTDLADTARARQPCPGQNMQAVLPQAFLHGTHKRRICELCKELRRKAAM